MVADPHIPSTNDVLLDIAKVAELRELMGNRFETLVSKFETTSATIVQDMKTALRQADHDSVAKHAHRLKGSCSNVGALQLANVCRALEEAALQKKWPHVIQFVATIAKTYPEVVAQLRQR